MNVIESANRIVVLGSGSVGRNIYEKLRSVKAADALVDVADSNAGNVGKSIGNIRVISYGQALTGDYDIFVLGFNASDDVFDSIAREITSACKAQVLSAQDVFDVYPEIRGWPIESIEYYISKKPEFDYVSSRLADEESVLQYKKYYDWASRIEGARPPEGDAMDQYFAADIIRLVPDEVFVDGGAYTGDTLQIFLQSSGGKFKEYYAFEPDYNSFRELVNRVASFDDDIRGKIYTLNMAILGSPCYVQFSEDSSKASKQDDSAGQWIQCESIDSFNFKSPPTFLKLDLEGGDKSGLMGSMKFLDTHRPIICIAIYHKPEDLTGIPMMMMGILENYRFYIRAHNRFAFDFVLYCVPNERCIN